MINREFSETLSRGAVLFAKTVRPESALAAMRSVEELQQILVDLRREVARVQEESQELKRENQLLRQQLEDREQSGSEEEVMEVAADSDQEQHQEEEDREAEQPTDNEEEYTVVESRRKRKRRQQEEEMTPPPSQRKDEDVDIRLQKKPSGSTGQPTATTNRKPPPPPPIVLTDKESFTALYEVLREKGIKPKKSLNSWEGIKIFLNTTEDYRTTRRIMDANRVGYHTFQLPEERQLKVVIRGIPEGIPEKEVEKELSERNIPFSSVKRLGNKERKFPMMLVNAPKNEEAKKIFDMEDLLSCRVSIEPKRRPTRVNQCFRCQKFGHVQYRCTAEPRCMK